jgi:hypothetical protein
MYKLPGVASDSSNTVEETNVVLVLITIKRRSFFEVVCTFGDMHEHLVLLPDQSEEQDIAWHQDAALANVFRRFTLYPGETPTPGNIETDAQDVQG